MGALQGFESATMAGRDRTRRQKNRWDTGAHDGAAFVRYFNDDEPSDWTLVEDASPNITVNKGFDRLAVYHPGGDAAAEFHGLMWSYSPAGDFYIEASFNPYFNGSNYCVYGVMVSTNNTYGAGSQLYFGPNATAATTDFRAISNWSSAGSTSSLGSLRHNHGKPLFVRAIYNSGAGTWDGEVSVNGITWWTQLSGFSTSISASYVGLGFSSWGSSRYQCDVNYVAVYEGTP